MTLISSTLANLINGVSQQPASQRLPSQVEIQTNAYGTITEGLMKRPPFEHVKVLATANITGGELAKGTHCHWFELNEVTYVAVITNGAMKVFDLTGTEYTVTLGTNAATYLTLAAGYGADVAGSFRALTLSDRVLFLNRTVSPRREQAPENVQQREGTACAIFVRQGDYSTDYAVTITGTLVPSGTFSYGPFVKTTLDAAAVGAAADIKTTEIALDIGALITAAAIPVLRLASMTVSGSTIILVPGADCKSLRISVGDSKGNTHIVGVKDTVQQFTDLPATCLDGFGPVTVVGAGAELANPYYVTFDVFNPSLTIGEGAYLESDNSRPDRQPLVGLWARTMPFSLTKSGAVFTLAQTSWETHDVGDEVSNPGPSFDKDYTGAFTTMFVEGAPPIQDLFLYRNRLGIIYGDKVALSEHGEYFNFFRTTVTALLDTDPIDVKIAHAKSSILRSACPYQNNLVLFTDQAQFLLTGGDTLTPASVGAAQISEFDSSTYARPVASGSYLFFPFSRGDYSGVREFSGYIDTSVANGGFADAADVTGHVPKYIPGQVYTLCASTHDDVLVAHSPTEPDALYVYKYYWSGDQKVQSAWSKFTAGSNCTINGVGFIRGTLYLIVTRANVVLEDLSFVPGGTCLEKILLSPGQVDTGGNYLTLMDRRITEASCTVVYNAVTDITTYTLPYRVAYGGGPVGPLKVVTRPGATSVGQNLAVASQDGYTLTVAGNKAATPVYIGQPYTMTVRLSTLYYRRQLANGSTVADQSGRLQLKRMMVSYADTGFFLAQVTPELRSTFTHTMNGRTVAGSLIVGSNPIVTGQFSFPILSKNDQVTVDLVNSSPLPCRFLAAEWTGVFTSKSSKV